MVWFSSPPPPPPPPPEKDNSLLFLIIFILFVYTANKQGWGQKEKKEKEKKKDPLDKIIGLESVKDEIKYYMDFIKNKDKYKEWGVKLPKGILLAGPPGTGKTLLVKTLSEKLDIPLITASGSEFIEMYVGVGAKRVRELFEKLRRKKNVLYLLMRLMQLEQRENWEITLREHQLLINYSQKWMVLKKKIILWYLLLQI